MATVRNVSSGPLSLTGGTTLPVGQEADVNPDTPHEAALIASRQLRVIDPDGPVPPIPPDPTFVIVDVTEAGDGEVVVRDESSEFGWSTTQATSPSDIAAEASARAAADTVLQGQIDTLSQARRWKEPVKAATTGNVSLTAAGSRTVDGYSTVSGDRILLVAQTAGAQNGIYTVGSDFALTRATDADTGSELEGAVVLVQKGSTLANKVFKLDTDDITLGTTSLVWSELSGSGGSGGAVSSVAGRTGDVVLTKTDVGLANVDNTSDANKPVSTAQALADTTITANTQTGSYTLVLADAGKVIEQNSASATVVTIPPSSSVAFPTGTVIEVCRIGAGSVTITPGSGVTIPNRLEATGTTSRTIAAQYSTVSLRKRATDTWVLVGDVA